MDDTENTGSGTDMEENEDDTDIEEKEEERTITGSYPDCAQTKELSEQLDDKDIESMSSWAKIMKDQEELQYP